MNSEASLLVRAAFPKLKCAQGPGILLQLSAWGPRFPGGNAAGQWAAQRQEVYLYRLMGRQVSKRCGHW